jgi:DTW domain-containing protein YfiP
MTTPAPADHATPPGAPPANKSRLSTEVRAKHEECRQRAAELRSSGLSDAEVYKLVAKESLERRMADKGNRCERCWHDKAQRCICDRLVSNLQTKIPVKGLVLMHYSEFMRPGDDAKLLMAMLPEDRAELFIFPNDLPRLLAELAIDPVHNLLLWPNEDALTVEQFQDQLPKASPWHQPAPAAPDADNAAAAAADADADADAAPAAAPVTDPAAADARAMSDPSSMSARPLMRVVVLDAVYRHARMMFRHLTKVSAGLPLPPPLSLSVSLSLSPRAHDVPPPHQGQCRPPSLSPSPSPPPSLSVSLSLSVSTRA